MRTHAAIRRAAFRGPLLLVLAGAFATLPGTATRAHAAPLDCHSATTALRESLEVVVETVIDGRKARLPRTAEGASVFWEAHHGSFDHDPDAGAQMAAMVDSARRGSAREAARLAVQVAVASLKWCNGPLRTEDQLMLLDFVGMTAWLRARGGKIDWPDGIKHATDDLAGQLVKRRKTALAKQLRAAVTVAMAPKARVDVKASARLLALVDDVEKALR